jgi:DNA-binding NtrC family response regulator
VTPNKVAVGRANRTPSCVSFRYAVDANSALRPDLLWRLSVIHIRVPPLRERPEDIVHIAWLFLAQAASVSDKRIGPVGRGAASDR